MVSDFAIKIEAKGNFENSPESQTFCMTCGGFFTLFACMCFLTFTLTNNSQRQNCMFQSRNAKNEAILYAPYMFVLSFFSFHCCWFLGSVLFLFLR